MQETKESYWAHNNLSWTPIHLPNGRLYKTMVVLTFYPPMPCFLPFQIRLCFHQRDLAPKSKILTTNNSLCSHADKVVTLPPQFLNDDTVSAYIDLSRELTIHAILHDKNYRPWKITYKNQEKYSDHPNELLNRMRRM